MSCGRRQFVVRSGVIAAGLSLTPRAVLQAAEAAASNEQRLVRLGINALARAHEKNYFANGHRGAALISAHMMCINNRFEKTIVNRIAQLFEMNWASGSLCEPFPENDPVEDAVDQVGKALSEGSGTLREVGHDAIFAMHAVKAFRMLPETATPERVAGVCKLVRAIKPWRDVKPDEGVDPPPFTNTALASQFVLREASDAIDRFVGYGQGFAGHMLTFGQSLVELAAMGDEEWAENCRTAFRKYVTVTRQGPQAGERRIKDHKFSELRPDDAEYWQKRSEKTLGLGHVFKYPYAYYDLVERAKDAELAKTFDAKAWQLF